MVMVVKYSQITVVCNASWAREIWSFINQTALETREAVYFDSEIRWPIFRRLFDCKMQMRTSPLRRILFVFDTLIIFTACHVLCLLNRDFFF